MSGDSVGERRKLLFHRWLRIQARRAPAARVKSVMASARSIQEERGRQGDNGDFVQAWIDALARPEGNARIDWLLGSRDAEAARLRRSSPLPIADPDFTDVEFRKKLASVAKRGARRADRHD